MPSKFEEALAGEHGDEMKKLAEDAVDNAVKRLAEMFNGGTIAGAVMSGANFDPGRKTKSPHQP
jgi:hypothetical protein